LALTKEDAVILRVGMTTLFDGGMDNAVCNSATVGSFEA